MATAGQIPGTPLNRRTTRAVLTEIPIRTLRAEQQVFDPFPLNTVLANNGFDNTPDRFPSSYLSPSPSPDELVIQQRGRRKMPASWSPIDHKKNSPFRSALRTPPKNTPATTSPIQNGIVLRSTPRKRLLMGEGDKPSPSVSNNHSSPQKSNQSPTKLVPSIKRLKIEKNSNDCNGNLSAWLKGLNKNQMLEVFQSILASHPEIEDEIKNFMPPPDMKPIEEKLLRLKRNIFKSLPSSRLISRTDSPAYSRAHIHLTTFRKYVITQGKKLIDSQQWSSVLDYVFLAWSYVRATPLWDNQVHNLSRKQCFKSLSSYCLTALRKASFDKQNLLSINDKLQSLIYDNDDLSMSLKYIESLIGKIST